MTDDVKKERLALDIAHVARDMAMDILGLDKVLALHDINPSEWERLKNSERFQRTLSDMQREWNAASNTRERLKAYAGSAIEALIEPTVDRILDPDTPFIQAIEGMKFLSKLAELGDSAPKAGTGSERIVIQIVTGRSEDHMVTINAAPQPAGPVIDYDADVV